MSFVDVMTSDVVPLLYYKRILFDMQVDKRILFDMQVDFPGFC